VGVVEIEKQQMRNDNLGVKRTCYTKSSVLIWRMAQFFIAVQTDRNLLQHTEIANRWTNHPTLDSSMDDLKYFVQDLEIETKRQEEI